MFRSMPLFGITLRRAPREFEKDEGWSRGFILRRIPPQQRPKHVEIRLRAEGEDDQSEPEPLVVYIHESSQPPQPTVGEMLAAAFVNRVLDQLVEVARPHVVQLPRSHPCTQGEARRPHSEARSPQGQEGEPSGGEARRCRRRRGHGRCSGTGRGDHTPRRQAHDDHRAIRAIRPWLCSLLKSFVPGCCTCWRCVHVAGGDPAARATQRAGASGTGCGGHGARPREPRDPRGPRTASLWIVARSN